MMRHRTVFANQRPLICLLAIGAASVLFLSPARAADMSSALQAAMDRMDRSMTTMSASGNADADFARMMIPHHLGAVDMAKAELLYGHDRRLRRLAQEIIVTQESEITVMRAALHDPAPTTAPH